MYRSEAFCCGSYFFGLCTVIVVAAFLMSYGAAIAEEITFKKAVSLYFMLIFLKCIGQGILLRKLFLWAVYCNY